METIAATDLDGWVEADARDSRTLSDRYLFGLVGPPGSGKSTLAAQIATSLDAPVVPMDGFHLANATLIERGLLDVKGAPDTFAVDRFVEMVRLLRNGGSTVSAPVFDRTLDEPVADAVTVTASDDIVVIEGNYLLVADPPWSVLRALFGAVAYIDMPTDVRIDRLVARHIEFGKTPREAADFVHNSDERNTALVAATRARASLIVKV